MRARPGPLLRALVGARGPASLGRAAGLGFVGGLGLIVASATLAGAADDADIYGVLRETFRLPLPQRAAPERPRRGWPLRAAAPARPRYVSLPPHRTPRGPLSPRLETAGGAGRILAADERAGAVAAAGAGWLSRQRTLCVRLCDGYAFPVGLLRRRRDVPVHQAACETSCPGAATALFTLRPGEDDVMAAVSLRGRAYASLRSALAYRRAAVPACSCHGPEGAVPPRMSLARDGTLRAGDVVAGRVRAYVLTAGEAARFVDYRSRGGVAAGPRHDLDRLFGPDGRSARVRLARAASGAAPGAGGAGVP